VKLIKIWITKLRIFILQWLRVNTLRKDQQEHWSRWYKP